MTDIHAAVAVHQVARLDAITSARSANAQLLSEGLAGVSGLILPRSMPGRRHAWHQYVVRITPEFGMTRERVMAELDALGVSSAVYYPKLLVDYPHVASRTVGSMDFPNAQRAVQEVLALPVHPGVSRDQIQHVVDAVRKVSGG
jgi:dTDP-4-amino-4,6-dideoxygalactose transaminase